MKTTHVKDKGGLRTPKNHVEKTLHDFNQHLWNYLTALKAAKP